VCGRLDRRVHERREAGDRRSEADHIQPRRRGVVAAGRDQSRTEARGQRGDGDADEEHRAP
jgi:hypothetical protein